MTDEQRKNTMTTVLSAKGVDIRSLEQLACSGITSRSSLLETTPRNCTQKQQQQKQQQKVVLVRMRYETTAQKHTVKEEQLEQSQAVGNFH